MEKSKGGKFLLAVLVTLFTACFAGAVMTMKRTYADGFVLASEDNGFEMTETSFGREESFIFSCRADFKSGVAAGIVFGGTENGRFVLNVDRDNFVKLLYFNGDGVTEVRRDYYVGNDTLTESQKTKISGEMKERSFYYLKVIVSGGENPTAQFFVDGILRFDYEEPIALDNLLPGVRYEGGKIGYNCFNAEVKFGETFIGETDDANYTEIYRNQYHYSQPTAWNNDPNGLVFDGEYYHMFYQTNPFKKVWSNMYWGHARSKDLVYWQTLPLCLFPDDEGYMWSGSAIIDKDNLSGYFSDESKTRIIAYLTIDAPPKQHQRIMTSEDGGFTWVNRGHAITASDINGEPGGPDNAAFRDPKVFKINDTVWGMIIGGGIYRFYTSENLKDWKYSSRVPIDAECPDIYKLGDKWVIAVASRKYIVGDLTYDNGKVRFYGEDGKELTADSATADDVMLKTLDYGDNSYANQSFYIADERSAYNGKTITVSWFSAQPGTGAEAFFFANHRDPWNGGFTIPAELGLKLTDDGYRLTSKPLGGLEAIEGDVLIEKTETVNAENELLKDVKSNTARIRATVTTSAENFGFKVFVGEGEYTVIGYSAESGYYFDRTNTSYGKKKIDKYNLRYDSGVKGNGVYTFDILLDRNAAEVFAGDYTVPFYMTTLAAPTSRGMEFFTDGEAEVDIKICEMKNIWRDENVKGVLVTDMDDAELDTKLNRKLKVIAYTTDESEFDVTSVGDAVTLSRTEYGLEITAVKAGTATVNIGGRQYTVTVYDGMETSLDLGGEIQAGEWNSRTGKIIGEIADGDGFFMSGTVKGDFFYAVNFDLKADAAALIMRAAKDRSTYYIANYDGYENIVKLWSDKGELGRAPAGIVDRASVSLAAAVKGGHFDIYLNGRLLISVDDETAPAEGYLGLNVFKGTAEFSGVYLEELGDYVVYMPYVKKVLNFTKGNTPVPKGIYTYDSGMLRIKRSYINTLSGLNEFYAVTDGGYMKFDINVLTSPENSFENTVTEAGLDVTYDVYGKVEAVKVNGAATDKYTAVSDTVRISGENFAAGENTVEITVDGKSFTFKVTVNEPKKTESKGCKGELYGGYAAALFIAAAVIIIKMKRSRNGG